MDNVGQIERITQNRVVKLFKDELNRLPFSHLDWKY